MMNKILIPISIISANIVSFLSKITGHKSSSLPGKVARIICPNILRYLGKQIRNEIIIVTGTNGKTTTNNMLRDILKAQGQKVVCNDVGANMINGVVTAFIKDASIFGKLDKDYACIEVDEASLKIIVNYINPNKVVITNLFRDQLDRYGEIDLTIKQINQALDKLDDNVLLILNADDPLSAQFGVNQRLNTFYYGIGDRFENPVEESREGRFCTICGQELTYNYYFYSQLGDYYCTKCGFKRPASDISAKAVSLCDSISIDLIYKETSERININYAGLYNVYNVLAAISSCIDIASIESIKKAMENYKPQIGRMEKFYLGVPVVLNLSKNPAGFNQGINTVSSDNRKKNVLIIINDNDQDGRDVSWLWDCDFENLKSSNIDKYYVSGIRKEDMAVRLKYAGIKEDKIFIEGDIKKSIQNIINDIEIAYILVNYTALFETQNILKDLESVYK